MPALPGGPATLLATAPAQDGAIATGYAFEPQGDTLVYVEGGWAERKADELAAVRRIFGLLPDAQAAAYLALWHEFEAGETAESRFANAADRAMPVLLNLANNGQSWRENGISHARVVARVAPQIEAGCPALWRYLEARLDEAQQRGWFGA